MLVELTNACLDGGTCDKCMFGLTNTFLSWAHIQFTFWRRDSDDRFSDPKGLHHCGSDSGTETSIRGGIRIAGGRGREANSAFPKHLREKRWEGGEGNNIHT